MSTESSCKIGEWDKVQQISVYSIKFFLSKFFPPLSCIIFAKFKDFFAKFKLFSFTNFSVSVNNNLLSFLSIFAYIFS